MIAIMSVQEFFDALGEASLPGAVRTVSLDVGQTLFRQGDPSPGLGLILDGEIDLVRWTASGRDARIHFEPIPPTLDELGKTHAQVAHARFTADGKRFDQQVVERFTGSQSVVQPGGPLFSWMSLGVVQTNGLDDLRIDPFFS